MNTRENILVQLLRTLPLSYQRNLEGIKKLISTYLPKSLIPSYPTDIIIDPVNICNLKCPLCPTGLGKLHYKPLLMSIEIFKLVIDKIPTLKHICLFNWGEPFLNPALFEMIQYAHENKIRVTIHSNFSFNKDDKFFLNILESKLDILIISLDGASQQSYSKYRIGGNFNLVLSNMNKLAKIKNQQRLKHPKIIWKFIVNRFNEKEVTRAKEMADSMGIQFETSFLGLSDDLPGVDLGNTVDQRIKQWLPQNKNYQHPYYRNDYKYPLNNSTCTQLFKTLVVNPDGKVFPCCWATDEKWTFGDLTKESFEDIWHNSYYMTSRSLFSKEAQAGSFETTICSLCNNFKKVRCL